MNRNIKEVLKKFIPNALISFRRQVLANKKLKYGARKRSLLRFEIHVTDHCNLNCKSCSHFSPLAQGWYLDLNQFQNDCKRLALLTNGKLEDIIFLGGEPLLHPNLGDIFKIARKYFKTSGFSVTTNGILLLKQTKTFWENCRHNNVQIYISCYPINLAIKTIRDIARFYGVKIRYAGMISGGGGVNLNGLL